MIHALALVVSTGVGPPYPSKPPNVHAYYAAGRLLSYSLGNHSGTLTIALADGARESFVVAQPNKINGHHYLCQIVPWAGEPPRMRHWGCSEIPPNIVVRQTTVRVTYWWSKGNRVSDEIDTIR